MVTDQQVRKLMKLIQSEETLALAAAPKREWMKRQPGSIGDRSKLPSQCQQAHTW